MLTSSVFLSVSAVKLHFAFAFSAACSLTPAAAAPQYARGGYTGAFRCTQRFFPRFHAACCVDSAVSPVLPAPHFSGCIAKSAITVTNKKRRHHCLRFGIDSLHRLRGRVGVGVNYTSIRIGFSNRVLKACKYCAPSAPSLTR